MALTQFEQLARQDFESMRACPHGLDCPNCPDELCVKVVAEAEFPSDYGQFRILAFVNNKDGKDHTAVLKGEIGDGHDLLCRIHSACLTGDALGSRRCDCGPQLHEALSLIEREGRGLVLYHQAEGRGIGLANKLRAYVLQDRGFDTLEANTALGFAPDERDYAVPAEILRKIGVKSVRLLTNNPVKVEQLGRFGVEVRERRDLQVAPHADNLRYLQTKLERFGHLLHLDDRADGRQADER
jgi:3,4-dihydroxy 2-butanone 4-phosphate synthase/GTP cyclohydrolase II